MFIHLTTEEPIHRQVYAFIRASILSGRLPSGSRLPSTRDWATQLNISRTVVLQAFEQLIAEGYIRGVQDSGTVVCAGIPELTNRVPPALGAEESATAAPDLSPYAKRLLLEADHQPPGPPLLKPTDRIDFHYGNWPAPDFPHLIWRRLALHSDVWPVPTGSPTEGYLPLRGAIASHLERTRAVQCSADQVIIVNGSQQAIDLLTRLFINPKDVVLIEDPHYHVARHAFLAAGARLVPGPVDEDGLCIERLPRVRGRIKLIYVTPSHQFPTGAVLPFPRRLALLEWAERKSAFIIEDDYDGELRYDTRPIEAVQSLDKSGRVIYVGTVSKALSPELRIGYVVAPVLC